MAIVVTVIVTLAVMVNAENVHAQTLTVSPSQVTQGTNVEVTGNGFQPAESGEIQVFTSNAAGCSAIPIQNLDASTDENGNLIPVTIQTDALAAGTYCVEASGFMGAPDAVNLIVNPGAATGTGESSPLAAYPTYVPLVVIFIVLAYAAIKRRKRSQEAVD